MLDFFKTMFSYDFMVQAIVVGLLVTLCSALLGVSMVLKRYSMIGDGLSHVGFAALAIGAALNIAPLQIAIPVCIIAAFLLLKLSSNSKIKGDQAIAVLCNGALAVGVMVISLSSGMNTDVNNYMFGSILSIDKNDAILTIIMSVVVIMMFIVCYNRIFSVTFDENFAKATGTKADAFNLILAMLTAVTVVVGMRIMGALLISSLIIFPSLTAMRVCKTYKKVVVCAVIVAIVSFIIGIIVSFGLGTPTGASIVCINLVFFALFALIGLAKQRF